MPGSIVDKAVLIDDSDIDLFIQRRFLEVHNFSAELRTYKSAEEALEWLKSLHTASQNVPEVIFLDLNMPEIDGFGFLNLFKELPVHIQSKSKIVVVTSSNNVKDREKAFTNKNVIHFITKPLKKGDLEELKTLLTSNSAI